MIATDSAQTAPVDRTELEVALRLASHLMAAHGGHVDVVSIHDSGLLKVRFGGLCTSCPLKPITLRSVVEPILLSVTGVTAVEAAGCRLSEVARTRLAGSLND